MNDFRVLLQAVLDKSGINTELKEVQDIINKYSVEIMPELKTASLRNQMKTISKDIANDFNKTFGTNLTGNDVFRAYENQAKSVMEQNKLVDKSFTELRKNTYQSIGDKSPELKQMAEMYKQEAIEAEKIATERNKLVEKSFTDLRKNEYQSVGDKSPELQKMAEMYKQEAVEAEKVATAANKINQSISSGTNEAKVEKLTASFRSLGLSTEDTQKELSGVNSALKSLNGSSDNKSLVNNAKALESEYKKVENQIRQMESAQKGFATESQRLSKTNTIKTWADNNSKAMKVLKADVNTVLDGFKKPNLPITEYNRLNAEFEKIKFNAREMGLLGKTIGDSFKDMGNKFFSWITVSGLIMTGFNSFRKMKEEVITLNNSLLELSKVSDLSAKGLADVADKAYKLGETVGKTGTQVIDAITEFKRAGYELSDSIDMAEAALMMTNVAEGITETSDAAGTLISVLKGYNMSESQTMSIVDMLNSTSNQSPIGFDELADGLERTAGTMAQSGTTIQETIGLITAGYAQLRNVEKVSTSLITLSARLRGVNEDGESIDGLSAELQKSFGKIGIAIEDADGNLRSIYQIAQDYSKVLPTLTDKQKQYYAELAAGKRNVTTWNAITQQFSDAEKATEQAINSVGSATEENDKYLASISGKISKNISAFQSLSNTLLNSDLIKFIVDLGTGVTNATDNVLKFIGTFETLAAGAGIVAFVKSFDWFCKKNCLKIA